MTEASFHIPVNAGLDSNDNKSVDEDNKIGLHVVAHHQTDPYPTADKLDYRNDGEPQNGVLQMEAITAVWSKRSLTIVYVLWVAATEFGIIHLPWN